MSTSGVEHVATDIGRASWKVKKKRIMEGISTKYEPKKTFDAAEKEAGKATVVEDAHLKWAGEKPVKKLLESGKAYGKRLRDWRKREPRLK